MGDKKPRLRPSLLRQASVPAAAAAQTDEGKIRLGSARAPRVTEICGSARWPACRLSLSSHLPDQMHCPDFFRTKNLLGIVTFNML